MMSHYHRRLWMVVTVMNGVTNLKQTQKFDHSVFLCLFTDKLVGN